MDAARSGALMDSGSLPELDFRIEGGGPLPHAAAPALRFDLSVEAAGGQPIRSVVLDVQVQIAARRRAYDSDTETRLVELFGESQRWGKTLRTLPWTRTTLTVPGFDGSTTVELSVPITYDFEVTATKYLDALRDGDVPLEFLFGGTFFYPTESGLLQTGRIGWDREAEFRLPVSVWRETMDHYFPDAAWLRLRRDTFDRLYAYRSGRTLTSWEDAIDGLLDRVEES